MPFSIEMTGAQDYQRNIKMAIGGYPGTGKTLFSSTAPQAFFVFFRDQPRIMSIAERYVPHTKLVNKYDSSGRLVTPIWETYLEVLDYMASPRGEAYQTFVVDTGDEFFHAIKEGRKAQNRGKWTIGDWGWLGDMYREIMAKTIDLPKHVITTFHLKNTQEGEDGEIVRELSLQGQAKDDAAGWFDIVAVLDSWEEDTPEGKVAHRGLLTSTTPRYPFVKDHSGKLPKVWEISTDFVGDFMRMHKTIYTDVPTSDHEVIEVIQPEKKAPAPKEKTAAETGGVPTPADLKAKKEASKKDEPKAEASKKDEPKAEASKKDEPKAEPSKKAEPEVVEEAAHSTDVEMVVDEEAKAEAAAAEAAADPPLPEGVVLCQVPVDGGGECGRPLIKAQQTSTGEQITDHAGRPVMIEDTDLKDLSIIRFRKPMCRDHFKEARSA